MNNSTLFKQAHAMTKQVIKQGDDYKTTFGLCLKAVKEKQSSQQLVKNNVVMLFVIVFVMFIKKASNSLKDVLDFVIFFVVIFFNPFALMLYNGLYLAIAGS